MKEDKMLANQYYSQFYSHCRIVRGLYPDKHVPFHHGPAFWNYPSGDRMTEGNYNRGIRAGEWVWYSEDGAVINSADFGQGEYKKCPLRNSESVYKNFKGVDCNPQNTILVSEDHGCYFWFWMPDRSIEEVVKWWHGLDTAAPYFQTPELLPGVAIEERKVSCDIWDDMESSREYYFLDLNEDYCSALITPLGDHIYHKNYEYAVMAYHSVPCYSLAPENKD